MVKDPYEVLGISREAGMDEIKRAYRKKAKECHPDLHPDDPHAKERMQEVNEAYDILSNPEKHRQQQGNRNYSNTGYRQSDAEYGYGNQSYSDRSYYGFHRESNQGGSDGFGFEDFFGFDRQQSNYRSEPPREAPGGRLLWMMLRGIAIYMVIQLIMNMMMRFRFVPLFFW